MDSLARTQVAMVVVAMPKRPPLLSGISAHPLSKKAMAFLPALFELVLINKLTTR
jgi:hypothetical protein